MCRNIQRNDCVQINKSVKISGNWTFLGQGKVWNGIIYEFLIYMFLFLLLTFTFTFSHLADAFIQSNLQMKTIEAIKPTKEQQHASAMTSLG